MSREAGQQDHQRSLPSSGAFPWQTRGESFFPDSPWRSPVRALPWKGGGHWGSPPALLGCPLPGWGAAPETPVMSLGGICDGPSVTALQQPQALSRCLWSRAPASAHAQRASSVRTVDPHPECCLCAEPWLVGVLRVPHSGCAVAVGTAEDSQPVPPPSLTASFRYPALARVVLVVWGEQRGWGVLDGGQCPWGEPRGTGKWGGQPLGLAVPQGCFCCRFSARKETLREALASSHPTTFWGLLSFPFLVPGKLRHFEHLSWQDMASGAEEAPERSGSAVTATASQLQRAGRWEAAADNPCSICLGQMDDAAYVDGCFHAFCFGCIRRWAATRAACPLCRQPFDRVLHTVRADDDYQEYVVGSSARRQRTAARERVRSRSPQRRYHVRPRPNNAEPAAGRRGPAGRRRGVRGDAAPERSDASARQAAGEHPASPADGPVLRYDLVALRARLLDFMATP